MKRIFLPVALVFPALVCLASYSHSAANLALNKRYSVSFQPNYGLAAPPTDNSSLTDGRYTDGYFWTQKTTVGWQNSGTVEILIDLGTVSGIGSLTFSTARGDHAEVNYPAHVYVFVGPDKEHYRFVGDVVRNQENNPGPYRTRKFRLDGVQKKGRYVLLEIVPNGRFVFCDEIEIIEGIVGNDDASPAMDIDTARGMSERGKRRTLDADFQLALIDKLGRVPDEKGTVPAVEWKALREQIIAMPATGTDPSSTETRLYALRSRTLRKKYPGKTILLEAVNPWSPLSPVSIPSSDRVIGLSFSLPEGGHDARAFAITNIARNPMRILVEWGTMTEDGPKVSLFQVPFVKSAGKEYVADPLVPLVNGVTLRPGESRLVMMTALGKARGRWGSAIKIKGGVEEVAIPVDIDVLPLKMPVNFTLNTVVWGYLEFRSIGDRQAEAVKDMLAHHTSVFVVPPGQLPILDPSAKPDFKELESYMNAHRGFSKALIFMGYGSATRLTCNGKCGFLDGKWKAAFRVWYEELVKSSENAGFPKNRIFLYPFDEMGGSDADRFVALASWARKEIPGIQFYATISSFESLKTLPYLDIAQLIDRPELIRGAGSAKPERWLYDSKGPAKSLSPYEYYRLMPWKSFSMGYTGAGFWNYADTGWGDKPGTAWDDFDGERPDYAVIYEGESGAIVSSRRWEAWRMGVEDYELLVRYSNAKGVQAARDLARAVLEDPANTAKADEVRRKILRELSS